MEFSVDQKNNARNIAFLNKTKNQAKKLFKLAKQKELKIEVHNLSHAQEILAHINGFPDWHALEKTVNNAVLENNYPHIISDNVENDNIEQLNTLEIYESIPILRTSSNINSFISIDYLPQEYEQFVELVNNIIKSTNFQFNMGFHKISLAIEQTSELTVQPIKSKYFSYNKNLGISEDQFYELFGINISFDNEKNNKFGITANIMIETELNMIDEHIKFCNLFKLEKFKDYFSIKEAINENEMHKYFNIYKNSRSFCIKKENSGIGSINMKFDLNAVLKTTTIQTKNNPEYYNHTQWIYALYLLSQRQHQWKIVCNLEESSTKKTFSLSHSIDEANEKQDINDKYVHGLYKSLTSTQFDYYNPFENDLAKMFPYKMQKARALPWVNGIPLVNITDETVEYYDPVSAKQYNHNTLIFARPGSGKSLFMNMLNIGIINSKSISETPYIGIIDIGSSSKSTIELIQELMPKEKKKLVQYHKIKMTEEYCINPFDTQLGCRFPTAEHENFLNNLLLLLIKDSSEEQSDVTIMQTVIKIIIKDMYFQTSEKGSPKKYDKDIDKKVDQAIHNIGIEVNEKTTWWEIVDSLFINNMLLEAKIAQRYAMPLLSDVAASLESKQIKWTYAKVTMTTGENLIEYCNRNLVNSLVQYKILSKPTVFDIDDARIVSLDLNEVAKSGGVQAEIQTAVIYLLARYALTRNYSYGTVNHDFDTTKLKSDINLPFEKYKQYYINLTNENKVIYKQLCFDEFHRVGNVPAIVQQITSDMKDSYKNGLGITLISQRIHDFNSDFISLAKSIFILDSGTSRDLQNIQENFNLTNYEKNLLKNVHGPRSGNLGVMLAKFFTDSGIYTKLVSLPINPLLMSALSTNSEDYIIREKLKETLGFWHTIKIMSKYYPYGFRKIIESRKESLSKDHVDVNIDQIYKDIMSDMILKEFSDK